MLAQRYVNKRHNQGQPIVVRIRTTAAGELIVENTLQRKTLWVKSNGVGLSNIAVKYQILNQTEPLIEEIDGWFHVTLPLLIPADITLINQ